MSDPRLSSINPYFPREEGGCIYPYFFDMKAGGELILGTLDKMYRSENIRDFMRDSYAYCLEHEREIRLAHREVGSKLSLTVRKQGHAYQAGEAGRPRAGL